MISKHRALIVKIAHEFGLSASLLEAQVWQESSDDPNAIRYEPAFFRRYLVGNPGAKAARFGPFGAISAGLLQIMVETACELGFAGNPWDLCDPETGLYWGARKFRQLLDAHHGDAVAALLSYNGGADVTYPQRVLAREQGLS